VVRFSGARPPNSKRREGTVVLRASISFVAGAGAIGNDMPRTRANARRRLRDRLFDSMGGMENVHAGT